MNNFKITQRIALALIILAFTSSSVLAVGAQNGATNSQIQQKKDEIQKLREEKRIEKQGEISEKACERITAKAAKIDEIFTQKETQAKSKIEARKQKLDEKLTKIDQEIAQKRTFADEKRVAMYTRLESRAQTEEQKKAVAEFKTTTEAAVKARKDAKDQARAAFREEAKKIIEANKTQATSDAVAFRAQIKKLHADAAAKCGQSGADAKTIATELRAKIEEARKNFVEDKKDFTQNRAKIQPLTQTRNAAFKKADEEFKKTMEAARLKLKTVFKNLTSTETGETNQQ